MRESSVPPLDTEAEWRLGAMNEGNAVGERGAMLRVEEKNDAHLYSTSAEALVWFWNSWRI